MFLINLRAGMAGCICALVALPAFAAQPEAAPSSAALLGQAIAGIKSQETRVQVLSVRAQSKMSLWSKKAGRMELDNSDDLSAVFDGLPEGRCRVDNYRSIIASPREASPYSVSVYSFGYNGRVFTLLQTKNGPFNAPISVRQGQISGNWLAFWGKNAEVESGYAFSIFGFPAYFLHTKQRTPLSAVLSSGFGGHRLPDGGIHGIITTAMQGTDGKGRRVVVITRTGGFGRNVLTLDPARAYSILAGKYFTWGSRVGAAGKAQWKLHRRPFSQFVVHGLFNPAAGVYFPKMVTCSVYVSQQRANGPYTFAEISVSRVRVNGPVPPFVVTFPRRTTVSIHSTGQVIHIGGTPQQRMKEINKAVAASATQPARNGGAK